MCPVKADWKLFNQFSHSEDIALLGSISKQAFSALDLPRYLYCSLWIPEGLPGIPGQWKDSRGFFGGAILTPTGKGRLIGGQIATTISVAEGLGLELEISSMHLSEYANLEQKGEVGKICRHALKLLSKAMYFSSDTMKFISIMALMEFLGTGPEYAKFEEVKKKLLPHLARNREEYYRLDTRFKDFTSHKQEEKQVGYRHRIIHEGDLLEDIIPDDTQCKDLFKELDRYIKKILADMCRQSAMSFEELQNWRVSKTQEVIKNA